MQNPADNKALTTLNERWEDVQAVITDLSDNFSNASQAAQYYFYSADADLLTLLTDEEDENAYYENYTEEDLDLIGAFMDPTSESSQSTLSSYRLDFTALYDDSGDETVLYNTESAFYGRIGQIDEADRGSLSGFAQGRLSAGDRIDGYKQRRVDVAVGCDLRARRRRGHCGGRRCGGACAQAQAQINKKRRMRQKGTASPPFLFY